MPALSRQHPFLPEVLQRGFSIRLFHLFLGVLPLRLEMLSVWESGSKRLGRVFGKISGLRSKKDPPAQGCQLQEGCARQRASSVQLTATSAN